MYIYISKIVYYSAYPLIHPSISDSMCICFLSLVNSIESTRSSSFLGSRVYGALVVARFPQGSPVFHQFTGFLPLISHRPVLHPRLHLVPHCWLHSGRSIVFSVSCRRAVLSLLRVVAAAVISPHLLVPETDRRGRLAQYRQGS